MRDLFWEGFPEFSAWRFDDGSTKEFEVCGILAKCDSEAGVERDACLGLCRQHKVPESSFYNWKRKLKQRREDDATGEDKVTPPSTTRSGAARKHTAVTFVPLELPTPPAVKPTSCEVVLPDGCRIILPCPCDPHWLREIIQVLKEQGAC